MTIELKAPGAQLIYEFDWSAAVLPGVNMLGVVHSVPAPLTKVAEVFDNADRTSQVTVSGGEHGGLYVISALAELSTGEFVPGQFTLRVAAS